MILLLIIVVYLYQLKLVYLLTTNWVEDHVWFYMIYHTTFDQYYLKYVWGIKDSLKGYMIGCKYYYIDPILGNPNVIYSDPAKFIPYEDGKSLRSILREVREHKTLDVLDEDSEGPLDADRFEELSGESSVSEEIPFKDKGKGVDRGEIKEELAVEEGKPVEESQLEKAKLYRITSFFSFLSPGAPLPSPDATSPVTSEPSSSSSSLNEGNFERHYDKYFVTPEKFEALKQEGLKKGVEIDGVNHKLLQEFYSKTVSETNWIPEEGSWKYFFVNNAKFKLFLSFTTGVFTLYVAKACAQATVSTAIAVLN